MGLFGGPSEPVDSALAQKLIASDKDLKQANVALSKNQVAIKSDLSASGEELLMLAAGTTSAAMSPGILVITNQSSAFYVKGKLSKRIPHSEVHSTRLLQRQVGGMLVVIQTFTSELDYQPNDLDRYGHLLQVEVATQRPAQAICATIDGITGRA